MKKGLVPHWFAALFVTAVCVCAWGGYDHFKCDKDGLTTAPCPNSSATAQPVSLNNQFWLDSIPHDAYTPFKGYVFTDVAGLSQDFASAFKVTIEMFEFDADQKTIKFHFMHDNRTVETPYAIEPYSNPKYPFLSATLTLKEDPQNGNKSKVYYTGPDFKIGSQSAVPSLQPLIKALNATL